MSKKFLAVDRSQPITLPRELEGWLSGKSLARFIVEIVETLDLTEIESSYSGGGSKPYPPKMILALLFYCYINGIFSSRKMEKATYELIPVIYITNFEHPDHSTIAVFRKRFIDQFQSLFVKILEIAAEMKIFKLGDISIDGTKIKANASKHKAMSWKYAKRLEAQLKEEIATLLKKAEEAESSTGDGGELDFPAEIQRREERLGKIEEAKKEIEARHKKRYEEEKKAYDEKMQEREEKEKATGKKAGGRKPKSPVDEPKDTDQVNFTDEESRIMPISGGGFEQCYNAQAAVDMESRLIVENHITQNPNDKKEVEPVLDELSKLPSELGEVERAALDAGYFGEENLQRLEDAGIEAHIPSGRQKHNQKLKEMLEEAPKAPENPSVTEAMQHRMKTENGKAFYAKRKSTIEPTFGIIKHVMGFRQFMLRGFNSVAGEWSLVCTAFNLKRLFALDLQVGS